MKWDGETWMANDDGTFIYLGKSTINVEFSRIPTPEEIKAMPHIQGRKIEIEPSFTDEDFASMEDAIDGQ